MLAPTGPIMQYELTKEAMGRPMYIYIGRPMASQMYVYCNDAAKKQHALPNPTNRVLCPLRDLSGFGPLKKH